MSLDDKKRVAVYPFSEESIPIVKYLSKFNPEYEITTLISPIGLGLIGKDASQADNRETMGIAVKGDIKEEIDNFDTLLITSGNQQDAMHKHSYEYMLVALENKKDIICLMSLSDDKLHKVKQKCNELGVKLTYCFDSLEYSTDFEEVQMQLGALYTPSVPVIFVGGLIDKVNNYEVLISTAYNLKKSGYKVSAIGQLNDCLLYGFHTQPTFLMNSDKRESERITLYNQFVNCIEEVERPDVILIQIPGGMMKYNDILTNDFGIYAYMISQAIQPDYFICCAMYGAFNSEFASSISENFSYKYGFEIDCIHMSNKMVDSQESNQRRHMCFLNLSHNDVNNAVKLCEGNSIPVYNLINSSDNKIMFENILSELNEHESAYSVL